MLILAKSKSDKRKHKRKIRLKQVKSVKTQQAVKDKGWFHYEDAIYFYDTGNIDRAVKSVKKAVKALPQEEEVIKLMGLIGNETGNQPLELEAVECLEKIGKMTDEMRVEKLVFLVNTQKYSAGMKYADRLLQEFSGLKIKNKRKTLSKIKEIREYCDVMLSVNQYERLKKQTVRHATQPLRVSRSESRPETKIKPASPAVAPLVNDIPRVPLSINVDKASFLKLLSDPDPVLPEMYELSLMSHKIRFAESFETLICLPGLTQVKSFWYQEETAKKVLKRFRGRALLSDEVGLGKTIEALIILSEYIKRGMAKTGLILTPTPLVSQWQEEMKSKFNLDVPSTDDPQFRSGDAAFWEQPLVIASINQAKSKKNSPPDGTDNTDKTY